MTKNLCAYAFALFSFVTIDLVWLMWLARPTYLAEMGRLLRKKPQLRAALAFYFLYALGLTFFAVIPGLQTGSTLHAMKLGGALGLVAYGTYDLTNLSVIEGYTLKIALIDLAWGTFLSGASAAIAVLLVTLVLAL